MVALAGPFIAVASLLAAAGAVKLARPATTSRALRAMGLPSSTSLVRVLAAAELGVGTAAAVWATPPLAALVAASYLAFAAFVLTAMARAVALSSCGCFGTTDTPPTVAHVVLNVAAAVTALAVALGPALGHRGTAGAGLRDLGHLDGPAILPVLFLALTATVAWFAYVSMTLLARVQAERARP